MSFSFNTFDASGNIVGDTEVYMRHVFSYNSVVPANSSLPVNIPGYDPTSTSWLVIANALILGAGDPYIPSTWAAVFTFDISPIGTNSDKTTYSVYTTPSANYLTFTNTSTSSYPIYAVVYRI